MQDFLLNIIVSDSPTLTQNPRRDFSPIEWKHIALVLANKPQAAVTVEKPSFRSSNLQNPVLFLNHLERYFNL